MNEITLKQSPDRYSIIKVLPVMFGFFIMGFVDLIGIAINYVKSDFALSDSMVNLISVSCFFWFFVLSVPTGLMMNRIGRKNIVLVSFAFTLVGLLLPLVAYSFTMVLVAFALIGIGNTIVQVALNPLVTNVVSKDKLTGTLTLGQFVKATSSLMGPILTSWLVSSFLGWRYIFPIYAVLTIIAMLWLWSTSINEGRMSTENSISFLKTLSLLKNKQILVFFIGIVILVGVDVGINTTLPKYLMEKSGMPLSQSVLGNSVYFFVRTISAFLGGIILMKYSEQTFYRYSVLIAFLGLIAMLFFSSFAGIIASVVIFGIGYANLFSIIFSLSLKLVPEKANEVSSLLIVGVSGGAVVTPLLGLSSDAFGSQLSAIMILVILWVYMVGIMKVVDRKRAM